MEYTTVEYKGKTHYIDPEGYNSLKVDHVKQEFVALRNNSYIMALSNFHNRVIVDLGIGHYQDASLKEYIDRTSDKKLKAQGLKRI